jgi:hypothetical protein
MLIERSGPVQVDAGFRMPVVRRVLWIVLAFFFGTAFSSGPALAQQPFYTDDAEVTSAGKVHIEVFNEYDWLQRGQAPHVRQNTFNMRANYGLGKGLELDIDSPLISILNNSTASPPRADGIGDTNFGIKYNFHEESGSVPALAAAVYIETPTGNPVNGLGSGLVDSWVYGIAQKKLPGQFVLRLNGGYLFTGNTSTGVVGITRARGHVGTFGASMVRTMTRRLDLGGEVAAAVAPNRDIQRAQVQFMLGGNYELRPGLTLGIGILGGLFVASPRAGLQIGFSFD